MLKKIKNKLDFKSIIIFSIVLITLTIVLLAFWPGILSVDSLVQWEQVKSGNINDAHPFYHTVFLLLISKIWNSTTIISIFQIISFSFIWTYICKYFRKKINYKNSFAFHIIYTIFICMIPLINIYSITVWKDILYSYSLLLLSVLFLILEDKKYIISYKSIIFLSFLILLLSLFRHNGLIVFILAIIFILIRMLMNKINYKKILVFVLSCLILYFSFNSVKVNYLNSKDKSVETSSAINNYIIFMISSYIHYGIEFDDEDEKIIYEIISPEDWINCYYPYTINVISSSPSKNTEAIKKYSDELKRIIIKYSLRHPTLLLKHYKDADAILWNVKPDMYSFIYTYSENNKYGFDYVENPILKKSNKFFSDNVNWTLNNNIAKKFNIPALPLYISIILTIIICIITRKMKYGVLILPMMLNTISLVPINLAQDLRYVYINYLTFFLILFVFINVIIKQINKYKNGGTYEKTD